MEFCASRHFLRDLLCLCHCATKFLCKSFSSSIGIVLYSYSSGVFVFVFVISDSSLLSLYQNIN